MLKTGGASTLEVVERVRAMLPLTLAKVTKELNVATLFDQSGDSRAAIRHINEYRKLTRR